MYKMVFFQAVPVAVSSKLAAPRAEVQVDGVAVDQPICQSAEGTPVWAAMVPTAEIENTRRKPEFLGVGLDEVKAAFPDVYGKCAEKLVSVPDPKDPKKTITVRKPMDSPEEVGEVLIKADLPSQTFAGYDAKTGGVPVVKGKGEVAVDGNL